MDKCSYPPIYSMFKLDLPLMWVFFFRVGSTAQMKTIKQVAKNLKLELTQFVEL